MGVGARRGSRPLRRMAVSSDSRLGGTLCAVFEERVPAAWVPDTCARLEPGAKEWRSTRTTQGEKLPDQIEEQGDSVRLSDAREPSGEFRAGWLMRLAKSSQVTDSRHEAGETSSPPEFAASVIGVRVTLTGVPQMPSTGAEGMSWHGPGTDL